MMQSYDKQQKELQDKIKQLSFDISEFKDKR